MRSVKMAFLFCLASSIAYANPEPHRKVVMCDATENIFRALKEDFHEEPIWYAQDTPTPTQYVITVNDQADTWTLVQFDATQACVLGVGTGSRMARLLGNPVSYGSQRFH